MRLYALSEPYTDKIFDGINIMMTGVIPGRAEYTMPAGNPPMEERS